MSCGRPEQHTRPACIEYGRTDHVHTHPERDLGGGPVAVAVERIPYYSVTVRYQRQAETGDVPLGSRPSDDVAPEAGRQAREYVTDKIGWQRGREKIKGKPRETRIW